MNVEERAALSAGMDELGLAPLPARSVDTLFAYLDRLYLWNVSAGLTAVEREDAVRLHLLDSLALVPDLPAAGSLVDVGSGGGLPGIPLAVALPGLSVSLVEAKRRKASFLRDAVRELGMLNVEVVEERAETVAARGRRFDVAVSRACAAPRRWLEAAQGLVGSDGVVLVAGARSSELDKVRRSDPRLALRFERARTFELPGGHERRTVLRFCSAARDEDEERFT